MMGINRKIVMQTRNEILKPKNTKLNQDTLPILKKALIILNGRKLLHPEMESLKKNGTWKLSMLPRGKCTGGCRWVETQS